MFELHPQLKADTVIVGKLPLSLLLLSRDANYPWCILVPQREAIREIHELELEDRQQLLVESCVLSELMQTVFQADKMNVAALGNVVPQLHMHHIARYQNDISWPAPIWGACEATIYPEKVLCERVDLLRQAFAGTPLELDY